MMRPLRTLAFTMLTFSTLAAVLMCGISLARRDHLPSWVVLTLWVGGGLWFMVWSLALVVTLKVLAL